MIEEESSNSGILFLITTTMNLLQRYAMYHHRQVMAIYQIYNQIDAALPVMGCLAGRLYRIEIGISKRPVRFEDFQLNVCHFLGQLDKKRMPIPRLVYATGGIRLPIEKGDDRDLQAAFFSSPDHIFRKI